jgi:hypothetical protein
VLLPLLLLLSWLFLLWIRYGCNYEGIVDDGGLFDPSLLDLFDYGGKDNW